MGFPEEQQIVCSDTRAYKQFGNSVVVPIVTEIAKAIVTTLTEKNFSKKMKQVGIGHDESTKFTYSVSV